MTRTTMLRTTFFVMGTMMAVSMNVASGEDKPAAAPTATPAATAPAASASAKSIYDFTMKDIDGKEVSLSKYKNQVCIVVNVASKCGLTEESYTGLEALSKKYKDKGFTVLAFPANNFGAQEPGTDAEIKSFCREKKKASFDLFSKISVKGDDQAPLYKYLVENPDKSIAGPIEWNFQKYLVGRDGKLLAKFSPKMKPEDPQIVTALEKALAAPRG